MAMTAERFEALIKNLEKSAKRNPDTYRRRVGLLAILGFVYIFLMLGLALIFSGLMLWLLFTGQLNPGYIKMFVVGGLIVGLILRALWVRFPPPEKAIELNRQNAPGLFSLLDELT